MSEYTESLPRWPNGRKRWPINAGGPGPQYRGENSFKEKPPVLYLSSWTYMGYNAGVRRAIKKFVNKVFVSRAGAEAHKFPRARRDYIPGSLVQTIIVYKPEQD